MSDVTNPLTIQLYESYLPTAFDESLTLLQKVNKMIKAINDISSVIDGTDIEGLIDSQLNAWLNDGTLYSHIDSINVLVFGADNTGTRGTALNIQQGIDFIKTKGGGTLRIPAGIYLIDQKMTLCDNISIVMDEGAVLKRAWGGGFFNNGDWDNAQSTSVIGANNITITGGTIDGNYVGLSQYPAQTCDMLVMGWGDNLTIRDVIFKDVLSYHALDLNGMTNVLIENCQFKGYSNIINTTTYRESIQIGEASIYQDSRDNYKPCQNVTVRKCYFGPSENCGAPTVGVGNHYSRANVYQTNIVIEDNLFDGMTMFGARPYKWVDCKIVNNTFKSCPTGIQISNVDGGTESSKDASGTQTNLPQCGYDYLIEGNTFTDFTNHGIFSQGQLYNGSLSRGQNLRILGNYFSATAISGQLNDAISLRYWDSVNIKNNAFKDSYRALVLYGCKYIDMDFNKIQNVSAEAVATLGSDVTVNTQDGYYVEEFNIRSNEINGTQKNGVYLLFAKNFKVENNDINNPAQLSDGTTRGGIYCSTSTLGRIKNNYVNGSTGYNINTDSANTCTNIITFNNSGNGMIQLYGTGVQNGYYGKDTSGNITFVAV